LHFRRLNSREAAIVVSGSTGALVGGSFVFAIDSPDAATG